jgi:NADH dehydrogenase [ubiquinone] 1 alpha subcomplex assembly factor 7
MGESNARYYADSDPLGQATVTAPEISQMFGELIGLGWPTPGSRAGRPCPLLCRAFNLPGTLAKDALRAVYVTGWSRKSIWISVGRAAG